MSPLYGHDSAVAPFRDALDSGRLHHAWLISGPEGVGKALFAAKAALRVLAQGQGPVEAPGLDVPDDHPAARLSAAGSHPDLMRLERLLPTIRSRCRPLRLSRLGDDAMTSALSAALPDADDKEIKELAVAGNGSPGRALAWRGLDVAGLDRAMAELVRNGDPGNGRRSALAQSLALKSAQPRYEAFLARIPSVIAAEAKDRRGPALAEALKIWERAQGLAASARGLSLEPESVVFELAGMLASLAPSR
jgi:hypothetical protein